MANAVRLTVTAIRSDLPAGALIAECLTRRHAGPAMAHAMNPGTPLVAVVRVPARPRAWLVAQVAIMLADYGVEPLSVEVSGHAVRVTLTPDDFVTIAETDDKIGVTALRDGHGGFNLTGRSGERGELAGALLLLTNTSDGAHLEALGLRVDGDPEDPADFSDMPF